MIDHFSLAALSTALVTGVKKVTGNDPRVQVTPLERAALYGVGMILLGMLSWVVITTNENSTLLAQDRLLFTQIQQTQTLLQTQMSKIQEEQQSEDKRVRDLEYKVFGR